MEQRREYDPTRMYDVIVIGGGPAGLTAALYLARAKYRVLALEKEEFGGQITITEKVVNYPGIDQIGGRELTETMRRQGEAFGGEFLLAEALALELEGELKTVKTNKGDFYCHGILIATGAHPRTVGFQGEAEHKGRGVAYCATCDGEFFTDKEIFVIGGGFAAAEESVFLTKFAKHVTILIREEDFTCAASVADEARNHEKITVITDTVVEAVSGENGLNYIRYRNLKTGKITEYRGDGNKDFGVFVFVGYAPETTLVKGIVALNEQGYIITDGAQRTDREGVFAAGDVCIKPLRQIVTATGDGALAATELEKYVAERQRQTGITPNPVEKRQEAHEKKPPLAEAVAMGDGMLSSGIREQLFGLFEKMQRPIQLELRLDDRSISKELEELMGEVASLSDKVSVFVADREASSDEAPCVRILLEDGSDTGLAFHGVPGGHEFTSFILGIYNASGPGQTVEPDVLHAIRAIEKPTKIMVLVTLSCTLCPDTVAASQCIGANNPHVRAEIYDLHHFEELQKKYQVMSVPCVVINDQKVSFGKKNMMQILELIQASE